MATGIWAVTDLCKGQTVDICDDPGSYEAAQSISATRFQKIDGFLNGLKETCNTDAQALLNDNAFSHNFQQKEPKFELIIERV